MLHICRDFLSKNTSSLLINPNNYSAYLVACFLHGVLNFTQVGHTNFNIAGSSITRGSGTNNANLNLGGFLQYAVQLPGSYTVSISDIDRILALKSNVNGRYNSGLFRVTSFDTVTNSLILDARSWPIIPAPETNLSWKLFEKEESISFTRGNNTQPANSYRGWGNSSNSRVILQSPHSSGWQVRICAENSLDTYNGSAMFNVPPASIIPGFDGNASGDFLVGGKHLHTLLFYNSSPQTISPMNGRTPGTHTDTTVQPPRFYIWGDDSTGTCVLITRQHGSIIGSQTVVAFGLPENEIIYENQQDIHRLFVIGNSGITLTSDEMYTLSYNSRFLTTYSDMRGVAYGLGMQPITCIPSSWCLINQNAQFSNPTWQTNAVNESFTNATILSKMDLIAGTLSHGDDTINYPNAIDLEPRILGSFPFARKGRTNISNWSTSVDSNKSWLHIEDDLYMPWEGDVVP